MMQQTWTKRQTALVIGLLCIFVIGGSGIVSAAVSADFTTTYDGYDDGEASDAPGHEIAHKGQLEVTGKSAVDPVIVVKAAPHTVLDTSSVQIFVEGQQSIEFDKSFEAGEVRLSTDEIPSGTTIRLEYRTYYIGGSDSSSITASEVEFNYDRPGGDRTRETFEVDATLDNRPEEFVQAANSDSQLTLIQRILSYVGGAAIVLLLLGLVVKAIGSDPPPGGGGPGPG